MDNLRLDIEWDVNEADLKASMDRSKKTIEGAGQSVEVVESKVNNSIANMARNQGLLDQSWQSLNIQAQSYARIAATSLDPAVVAKYNKMLHDTQTQMARIKTMGMDLAPGATSRSGWNGLQNSINQISRELPAFTYSAQIGFMAISNNLPILADEIGRLKQANDELVASGKKGVPIWRQVVSSLLSWHTALSLGITLITVYGKEIGEFIVNLFKGGEAARIAATKVQAMNKAFESAEYGKAIKDLAELRTAIDAAKEGTITKERALQVYNDTVGKTAGQLQSFNDLEQWQIDNEKAYLELMYRKAQAQAYLQIAVDKTVESQKKALEGPGFEDYFKGIAKFGFGNIDDIAKFQNQLSIAQLEGQSVQAMKLFEAAQLSAQKFAKEKGLNFFGDDKSLKSATAKILSSYKSLMGEIKSLDTEYARKVLPDDQAEMKALEDKFAKIREKIIEFNKSAGSKIKIDLEWFDGMQREARTNLLYAQASDKLAEQYKKDYELYKQYEEDKKSLGEEFANEAAGGNLTRIKAFYKALGDEVDSLRAKITEGSATDLEKDRFYKLNPILVQLQGDELDVLRDQYEEALKLSETFFTKEQDIRKKHQDAFAQLEKNKSLISKQEYDERKNALKASLDEEMKALVEAAPEFKKAMESIDKSSRWMLADAFRNGKDVVYKLIDGMRTATNAEKNNLKTIFGDFFNKGITDATQGNYQEIAQLVDGFGRLVEGSFQFKDNLDGGLGTVADMVGMAAKLAKTLGDAMGEGGKGLSSVAAAGAIAGALLSLGSALSTGFNQARAAANAEVQEQFERQNERQLRATEAITQALQQQLELINEIYGADRLDKYAQSLEGIEKNWRDINSQLNGRFMMTEDPFANSILTRLNNGETAKQIRKSFSVASKEYYWAESLLDNLDKFTQLNSLPDDIGKAREELAKLQYQAALGNVDDYTQKLIDQLQAQLDLYDQTANKLREENTGNAFSAVLNDVKSLFQNSGEDSAEAWSKGFSKILDNYLMQKFSREYLEEAMQGWYELMDEYAASDGIDDDERRDLQREWEKIRKDGEKRVKDIQDAMGYDPESSDSASDSITGRINRTITESTGSEILGFERGRYTLAEKTLAAIEFANTAWLQLLKHQAAIENHTRDTAEGMSEAVKELKLIVRNTNGANGRTSEGMGLWS